MVIVLDSQSTRRMFQRGACGGWSNEVKTVWRKRFGKNEITGNLSGESSV